jgi:acetyl esterase/lipase
MDNQQSTYNRALEEDLNYRKELPSLVIWGEKMSLVSGTPDLVSFFYKGNNTLVLNIHGGAFCFKHPSDNDAYCHYLNNTYCVSVLNVDFSTSAKWGFPVQLIEVEQQLDGILRQYPSINRLIFVGHSSGANLATALAIKRNRDKKSKPIALLLDYPFLDLTLNPSVRPLFPSSPSNWPNSLMNDWIELYCPAQETKKDPLVSPVYLDKKEVKELPAVYIVTCKTDRLKDDAAKFASLLKASHAEYRFFEADERHGFIERNMANIYSLPNDPMVRYTKSVVDQEIIYALTLKH